ncbi:MAG: DUF4440 domain-containing protein [Nitrosomonas sp.]|nr:DUF4440 domain-containing protein [Nitrosomonas sp.]
MRNLTQQILALEEKLLHTDMQKNPLLLHELLAESFEEIGSTGIATSRQAVVDWLINKNINDRWLLTNFRVIELTDDVVLAIYHAQKVLDSKTNVSVSTRSSIWKRHGNQWKMVFHQVSQSNK